MTSRSVNLCHLAGKIPKPASLAAQTSSIAFNQHTILMCRNLKLFTGTIRKLKGTKVGRVRSSLSFAMDIRSFGDNSCGDLLNRLGHIVAPASYTLDHNECKDADEHQDY